MVSLLLAVQAFSQDKIKTVETPFISQLVNGEKYTIEMESWGCFGGDLAYMITVFKKQDNYYVTFNGTTKELSSKEIDYFTTFEKQLNQNDHSGACTSADNYTLTYNDSIIVVSDGSCAWRGYYGLKKKMGWVEV